MATRILMEDVSDFVKDTLLEIRAGLETANEQGIAVEIPEKVAFSFEIISDPQSLVQVTTQDSEQTVANSAETTEEILAGNEITTEAAVTDTETTARDTEQSTVETGADTEVAVYQYDSFED